MCEPTTGAVARPDRYCDRCDRLVGLDGLHELGVERAEDHLTVTVETLPRRGRVPVVWVGSGEPRPAAGEPGRYPLPRVAGAGGVAAKGRFAEPTRL